MNPKKYDSFKKDYKFIDYDKDWHKRQFQLPSNQRAKKRESGEI